MTRSDISPEPSAARYGETFISVDIEASGPIPGEYSMLSLGACVVGARDEQFYVELKPITRNYDAEALAIARFDLDALEKAGVEPNAAMAQFEAWTMRATRPGHRPIFVAYPIAFDWMFVAYYFHRFLKRNPFGIAGLDLKSFYAGLTGAAYSSPLGTTDPESSFIAELKLTHNALDDAIAQARMYERLLARQRTGG